MTRLSTLGGFPSDAIERAKAELAETLEFAEPQEPLARNLDGRVSAGGYIETHFNFAEVKDEKSEMKKLRAELAAIKQKMKGAYDESTVQRAAAIKKELSDYARQQMVNLQAASSESNGIPVNMGREAEVAKIEAPEAKVGKPTRAALDPSTVKGYDDLQRIMERNNKSQGFMPAKKSKSSSFSEAESEYDFARCQRPDGSHYGTGGVCRQGSSVGAKEKAAPKGDGGKARSAAKASGEVADRKAAARKENTAKKTANARTDSKMSSAQAAKVKADFDAKNKKTVTAAEKKAVRAQVKALDTKAKEAERAADKADRAWRKAGMPKGDQQKQVRALDKTAKAAEKAADRADRAYQKLSK